MTAIKDIASQLGGTFDTFPITANGLTTTATKDLANFEAGFVWYVWASQYTDGTYTFTLKDASTTDPIPPEKIIGEVPIISALTDPQIFVPKFGAISVGRFIAVDVVATNVTVGANIQLLLVRSSELSPTNLTGTP